MTGNSKLWHFITRIFVALLALTALRLVLQSRYNFYAVTDMNFPHHLIQLAQQATELYSFEDLPEISHGVVLSIAKIWKQELSQVTLQVNNRHVTDQIIQTGGEPERIMLITTWRSGSSYVGTLLKSRPGTFYFFEPLHNTYINTVREETEIAGAQEILRKLFYCENPDGRHTTDNLLYGSFISRNSDLFAIAEQNNLVKDPSFAASICRRSPIMAMKLVGLRLRHAAPLLADEKLNLKVIYLVRDPQATINSRLKDGWCKELSSCSNVDLFCSDLVDDFNATKILERDYPERFMVLQYEDLLMRSRTSKKLLKFLHIKADASTVLGSAKSVAQLTKWTEEMGGNLDLVLKIRAACAEAMKLWGY